MPYDKAQKLLALNRDKFAQGSAELLLWRICASDRCPGLINGEAKLCEAFHSEALAILTAIAAARCDCGRPAISDGHCAQCAEGAAYIAAHNLTRGTKT